VTAMILRASNEATGELRLLAGTDAGSVHAVELSAADMRAQQAPPAVHQMLKESHKDGVLAVAYPPDNSEAFATIGVDGTVRVWDVNTYSVTAKGSCQTAKTGAPLCLAFSGEALFTGWKDGKLRMHDADQGEPMWTVDNVHQNGVTALAVSHNKKFLVSGGENGDVRVWEIRTRDMIVNLKQHTMAITSLILYGDDSHVVSSSRDRTIYLWNLQSESRSASLMQRMGGVNDIALMPDHVQLCTVGQEKSVTFWDLRETDPLKVVPSGTEFLCIASHSSPETGETVFATADVDGHVLLWSFRHQGVLAKATGHSGPVRKLQFSPDGRQLVTVGDDGAVLVWNVFLDEPAPAGQ